MSTVTHLVRHRAHPCHSGGMTRTWFSMTVALLGGHGQELWPQPGRVLAVGPSHTFVDLAAAINTAFARWDHSRPSAFTLSDGTVVADPEAGTEIGSTVGPGDEFRFVVDPDEDWTHRCVVSTERIDPTILLGGTPSAPTPYRGWGTIPDPYGRRWADDDGGSRMPPRPGTPHPMLVGNWPHTQQSDPVDVRALHAALVRKDAAAFLDAISGKDVDLALQQVGRGLPTALDQMREQAEPVAATVVAGLAQRQWPGDEILAEDLRALLQHEELPGRTVSVDMDFLAEVVDGIDENSMGGYLDLTTGEVYADLMLEDHVLGDETPDPDEDPDRWLGLGRTETHEAWRDMADFAASRSDPGLRDRLEEAIRGRGAFRRFRDMVHDQGIAEHWDTFSTDRSYGRAREELARSGIRIV